MKNSLNQLACGGCWLLAMAACLVPHWSWGQSATAEKSTQEEGFEVLFDGSSLEAFRGYRDAAIGKGWKIDGNALKFDGSGGGDIVTRDSFRDFDLRFDWKVTPGANSGVMYRVTLGDPAPYFSGPEYQILDDDRHPDGRNEMTSAGSLYAMYKPEDKQLQPVGNWNSARIVVQDGKVEHWLNGKRVVSVEIGSEDWQTRKEASKFKDWENFGVAEEGHFAFQDHGNEVWFRNIRVKKLD